MPNLNTIHIDDDDEFLIDANKVLDGHRLSGYKIKVKDSVDFETGINLIKDNNYDLIILDLCYGPIVESKVLGEDIYKQIKTLTFTPIIFFTGLPTYVESLISDIVKVVNKGDGYDALFHEIEAILSTNYLTIKSNVDIIVKESLRSFFWDFVHPQKDIIDQIKDDTSLNYLLLRRLANMLSKEQIKKFTKDEKLKEDLSHPMEFYLYPLVDGEYVTGDILRHNENNDLYIILTPSCDLVKRPGKLRKAEFVLLIKLSPFSNSKDFSEYITINGKEKKVGKDTEKLKTLEEKLKDVMRNNKGDRDRFFYLPETPFIKASIVDFQQKLCVSYNQLESDFDLLTRLDNPFAQSMLSSFIRYYNRVGFSDLDIDYHFNSLFSKS